MNLGILLSPGDSLSKQQKTGQLDRLIDYYLKPYSKAFKKIFIFSYGDHFFKPKLPNNVQLVRKPLYIPYQFYMWLLPFWFHSIIKQIDIFRIFQTVGGLPALFIKKPFIVTYGYHYHQFAQVEKMPFKAQLIKLLIKPVLKKAQKIIVTSEENKQYLISKGYQEKLELIPNGVDPDKFKPGSKRDQKMVLSVGRLTHQKNYPLLIKAVSQSKHRSVIKLKIVGQGSLATSLKKLARKLKVNLMILKPVSHSKLVSYYQKALVFALTSKIEGQPKALLEAMSSGCACLTTPFAGNLIKHNQTGLIGHSVNSLSRQLDQLLNNRKKPQQLGLKARRFAKDNFDINQLVNKEINLLKNPHLF